MAGKTFRVVNVQPGYACLFGDCWSMILKMDSNPEMDLYLLHLISLHSPCLSGRCRAICKKKKKKKCRAKIYDSGILCFTASFPTWGLRIYLHLPPLTIEFDSVKHIRENLSTNVALHLWSLKEQSGDIKIKWCNTTGSINLGIFSSLEIYQCILENLFCPWNQR